MRTTVDPTSLPDISYGTIDPDYARHLASIAPDDDGPIWMVNLMRYRDHAVYADGRETDLSGREADDRYAPFGPFRTVGAELVFLADVEEDHRTVLEGRRVRDGVEVRRAGW